MELKIKTCVDCHREFTTAQPMKVVCHDCMAAHVRANKAAASYAEEEEEEEEEEDDE